MARQLANELAIPMEDWLQDALYCRRVRGYVRDDLSWMTPMPPGRRGFSISVQIDAPVFATLKGSLAAIGREDTRYNLEALPKLLQTVGALVGGS